jgi:hypothetical protein
MVTVDQLIKHLEKYKAAGKLNGKAEVMLEFDTGVAFEFFCAEDVNAMKSGMMEKFLILRPYTHKTAKRIDIRPKIFV